MEITKVDEMQDILKRQISLIKFDILSEQISDLIDMVDDDDEIKKCEIIEQLKEILTFIKVLK